MALLSATLCYAWKVTVSAPPSLLLFYYDYAVTTTHKPRRRAAKAESFLLTSDSTLTEERVSLLSPLTSDHAAAAVIESRVP